MSNQNKKIIFVLPAAVISFILGILAAQFSSIPFFICYCLSVFLFFVCLFLKNDEAFDINLLGLIFFLGAAHLSSYQALPKNHVSNYKSLLWQDKVLATGIIENEPQIRGKRARFILRLSQIGLGEQKVAVRGKILVQLFDGHNVSYGDKLILEGNFFNPHNFGGRGNFNYRRYLARQGIYGVLNVKKNNRFEVIAVHAASPVKEIALRFKQKIQAGFYANLPQSYAAVLSTMLLGDRSSLPKGISEVFIRTGTAHILAISGMNIAITAFILLIFLKILRIPRKPRYVLTLIALIFYNFITGAQPSVVRAVIMGSVVLVGLLLEREVNISNSLSFAALIILAYNPLQLEEIGFQLSFISVLSIVYLSPKIENALRFKNFVVKSFSVSLAAWVGTFLLIIYYFKIISPITILANLVIVPLVSVLTVAGFILILSIFFLPALAHIFGLTAGVTVFLLIKSAQIFSLIPGAYFYLK